MHCWNIYSSSMSSKKQFVAQYHDIIWVWWILPCLRSQNLLAVVIRSAPETTIIFAWNLDVVKGLRMYLGSWKIDMVIKIILAQINWDTRAHMVTGICNYVLLPVMVGGGGTHHSTIAGWPITFVMWCAPLSTTTASNAWGVFFSMCMAWHSWQAKYECLWSWPN